MIQIVFKVPVPNVSDLLRSQRRLLHAQSQMTHHGLENRLARLSPTETDLKISPGNWFGFE